MSQTSPEVIDLTNFDGQTYKSDLMYYEREGRCMGPPMKRYDRKDVKSIHVLEETDFEGKCKYLCDKEIGCRSMNMDLVDNVFRGCSLFEDACETTNKERKGANGNLHWKNFYKKVQPNEYTVMPDRTLLSHTGEKLSGLTESECMKKCDTSNECLAFQHDKESCSLSRNYQTTENYGRVDENGDPIPGHGPKVYTKKFNVNLKSITNWETYVGRYDDVAATLPPNASEVEVEKIGRWHYESHGYFEGRDFKTNVANEYLDGVWVYGNNGTVTCDEFCKNETHGEWPAPQGSECTGALAFKPGEWKTEIRCDERKRPATKEECYDAAVIMFGDKVKDRDRKDEKPFIIDHHVHDNTWVPPGCTVQAGGDWAPHWNGGEWYPGDNDVEAMGRKYLSVVKGVGPNGMYNDGQFACRCKNNANPISTMPFQ